jgi:hypothetical protein
MMRKNIFMRTIQIEIINRFYEFLKFFFCEV